MIFFDIIFLDGRPQLTLFFKLHCIFFYLYSHRCLSSEYTNIKIKNQKFVSNKKNRISKNQVIITLLALLVTLKN
jgi:hypothetical protein